MKSASSASDIPSPYGGWRPSTVTQSSRRSPVIPTAVRGCRRSPNEGAIPSRMSAATAPSRSSTG